MSSLEGPFLGRAEDLAYLAREAGAGLVTIVGLAGVGKTRLVREHLKSLDDETFSIFVSLVEVVRPEEVSDRIIAAFGLTPTGRSDFERIANRVRRREQRAVVVLDNAEHVLEEAAKAAQTLSSLEGVSVIVTSQEALGLADERVYSLTPLRSEAAAELLQTLARASNVEVTTEDALKLSDALDGLPLALELAAFRAQILSPTQIETRLHDSNRVLGDDSEGRHSSLDLALDYSWQHLAEYDRQLCKCLAYFDHAISPKVAVELWERELQKQVPDANTKMETAVASLRARSWVTANLSDGEPTWQLLRSVRTFIVAQTSDAERQAMTEHLIAWARENAGRERTWWSERAAEGLVALPLLREANHLKEAFSLAHGVSFVPGSLGFRTKYLMAETIRLVNTIPESRTVERCKLAILVARHCMIMASGESSVQWAERAVGWASDIQTKALALAQLSTSYHHDPHENSARLFKAHEAALEALELFEKLPTREPDTSLANAMMSLTTSFQGTGYIALAEQANRRAVELARNDPYLSGVYTSYLAQLVFDARRFEEAEAIYADVKRAIASLPFATQTMVLRTLPAYLAMSRRDYKAAHAALERMMTLVKTLNYPAQHYHWDQCRARLAWSEQGDATPYLEHAYYDLALVDGDEDSANKSALLLTFDLVYKGEFETARARLEGMLADDPGTWPSVPEVSRKIISAAVRFCDARLGDLPAHEPTDAFAEVVDMALASIAKRKVDVFDEALKRFDRARLYVPNFMFFFFEDIARSWTVAEINRQKQALLILEPEARRFLIDGVVYDFTRHPNTRKFVLLLAQRAQSHPEEPVTFSDIARFIWNAEADAPHIADRTYSTVSRIRSTTLLDRHIQKVEAGYFFASSLRIRWVDSLDDWCI